MRILSVEAKDFRAYPVLSWTLPEAGLYMIDAVTDTGRSNMAGKTTLLDSIFWGLFGWLPKWNGPKGGPVDSVIRRGTEKCQVQVTVENNGHKIRVVRQRPNKLQIFQDDEEIHGKSSDLDKRIEQLIGMTPQQFLLSVYIAQDRGISFFTMTDSERTQLLSIISGLEELDKGLAEAKVRKERVQSELDKIEGSITILEEQYNAIPTQKSRFQYEVDLRSAEVLDSTQSHAYVLKTADKEESLSNEEFSAEILQLQDERDARCSDVHSERSEHLERAERLNHLIGISQPDVEPRYFSIINEIKRKIAEVEEHNKKQEKIRFRNYQRIEKLNKILDDAERSGQGKCSLCKQDLPHDDREQHTQKLLDQAHSVQGEIEPEEEILSDEEYRNALEKAQQELANRKAEVESKPNELKRELNLINASIATCDAMLGQINSDFNAKKSQKESLFNLKIQGIRQRVRDAEAEFKSKQAMLAEAQRSLASLEIQEGEIKDKISEINTKRSEFTNKLNEALDLIDLFGPKGFRSVCFDGLIERISQRASQLFSLMTDEVYSTSLIQIREDSKGASKLVLRPAISKGGQEVPLDDLSGGARRMVMLAYDVAVSETIADSAPLLLDEALDGLDVVGKSEAMRLLESVSKTRPVFVIDHSSEFKSNFSQIITVYHKNGESCLGQ